jgi:hypothetical protein
MIDNAKLHQTGVQPAVSTFGTTSQVGRVKIITAEEAVS